MSALWDTARDLAAQYGYYGSVSTYRAPTMSGGKRGVVAPHTSLIMAIFVPGDRASRELLAAIGAERSTKLAAAPPGSDLEDGDEVHVGQVVYTVDGVEQTPELVICALSEVNPKGRALA